MYAVFRKELRSFFRRPVGYLYLALFLCVGGYTFFRTSLLAGRGGLAPVYNAFFYLALFTTPFLTSHLFSKEFRFGTDRILYSAPLSLFQWTAGNFLAGFCLYLLAISPLLFYGIILNYFYIVNWTFLFGNVLALLCVGFALFSMGIFTSALSVSKEIAYAIYYGAVFLILFVDLVPLSSKSINVLRLFTWFSFTRRLQLFMQGIFEVANIIFFFVFGILFFALTIRILSYRRQKVVHA